MRLLLWLEKGKVRLAGHGMIYPIDGSLKWSGIPFEDKHVMLAPKQLGGWNDR